MEIFGSKLGEFLHVHFRDSLFMLIRIISMFSCYVWVIGFGTHDKFMHT